MFKKDVKTSFDLDPPAPTTSSHHNTPCPAPTATADTGATGNFLAIGTPSLLEVEPAENPITVYLPDKSTTQSTHTAKLNIPELPTAARESHLFPALKGTSLISIPKLCDAGCIAIFDKQKVTIKLKQSHKVTLQGTRCPITGLWKIPITTNPVTHMANSVTQPQTTAELVQFSHATLGSPPLSSFKAAIKKHMLQGFPGLTLANVNKYPPKSIATFKGHMDQSRANQRSTKQHRHMPQQDINDPEQTEDIFPEPLVQGNKTHSCYSAILEFEPTSEVFSDQTGKFPVTSRAGNAYLFVLYDYDSNLIWGVPIKNRTAESILAAFQSCHTMLCKAGLRPKLCKLDNECSTILQNYIVNESEMDLQKVPPHIHRRNKAERAIRTYKNSFIAMLCGTDPDFPLNMWDKLIPQHNIVVNLRRSSRLNTHLSAYAQVLKPFDFNRTPMAPPGTKVLIHEKPSQRGTWDPHGIEGYYVGPALDHYRCYTVNVNTTKTDRIADTLEWFPHYVKMPTSNNLDLLIATTKDILKALQQPPYNSPLGPLTDSQKEVLQQFTEIFHSKATTQSTNNEHTPASVLRVPTQVDRATKENHNKNECTPAPLLRVPTNANTSAPSVTFADDNNNSNEQVTTSPNTPPPVTVTQESNPPPSQQEIIPPPDPTPDLYAFNKIIAHRPAPRGCGSRYQLKVDWVNHKPSYVPVNTFTDNLSNLTATEAVATYARENNLLNTRGWKCFKEFIDFPTQQAQQATRKAFHLTDIQKRFFQTAHHACLAQQTANKAINPDTGKLSEYPVLIKSSDGHHWEESCCEEVGRLAQGYPPTVPKGTNSIFFIRFDQIPKDRKATCLRLVCADRPMKTNPRRVRFTVGGDKVDYPGETYTKTADLTSAKVLFNSVISTPGAHFMGIDLKDFYLTAGLDRYEYMFIPVNCIPEKIMKLYNLHPLVHNGKVYCEIQRSMYGLPQAGYVANKKLLPILAQAGYHQSEAIPGLFKHETRPIAFCLVVDDFGVKYVGKEHAEHLLKTLTDAEYIASTDWTGETFCGLTLKWDYKNGTVDISMPDYVKKALQRFEHPLPEEPEDAPHQHTEINYGAKTQMTKDPDKTPPLDKTGIKRLQSIVGTLLYYARAVDNTMLPALGTLAAAQTKGTQATADAATKLLNYAATHPEAVVRFTASDMILHVHSDASYLSESEARSRAAGFFYLSSDQDVTPPNATPAPLNGPVHILCKIINNVMSSATEAEVAGLFLNGQDAIMLRNTLEFLGHPQPATPIQTDNSCAEGIANDTVKQKRSKAMDMRFYWIRDRVRQGQLKIHWKKGQDNYADYHTKHHPAAHHRQMRPIYLYEEQALQLINIDT